MLRSPLLYLARQGWLRHWIETSSVSRRLTSRFIAGHTLEEGIRAADQLSKDRILSTLDHLGENVTSLEEAARSCDSYLAALQSIERHGLGATVSVKLTQLGLDLSEEVCLRNVSALVERARAMNSRIEVDMESSAHTDRTLWLVSELHTRFGGHVRAVIQAYLHRSEEDIRRLSAAGIAVRLCKGAYREPPALAFQLKADVDRNYVKLMKLLLEGGAYPAIASHDEAVIRERAGRFLLTLKHIYTALLPFIALQMYEHALIWVAALWAVTFPASTWLLALLFRLGVTAAVPGQSFSGG